MKGLIETMTAPASSFHFFDISRLFERIVRSWGAKQIRNLGRDEEADAGLTMERMVILTGTLKGVLVVRSTPDFTAWLREQRQDSQLGRYPAEEIFEELISLFCLYLFHDFWRPNAFEIGPIQPFPSIPSSWPQEHPHASCALRVEDHRVEIRLWMKD